MSLIKSFPNWSNLSDFFEDDWFKNRFLHGDWMPAVNVIENDDNYEIELAAPGMKKEDFEVKIDKGMLTIKGKAAREAEEKEKNFTRKEFSYRSFTKSFTLPKDIDAKSIKAKYEDGVLQLLLMKTEVALPEAQEVAIE
jgi:HSP20 family protein